MDILLFKRDLEKYPKKDILDLAKMYGFHGGLNDLRWMVAIRHYSQRGEMLSGDPNVDKEILEKLDNSSLVRMCTTDKSLKEVCDEIFAKRKDAFVEELNYAVYFSEYEKAMKMLRSNLFKDVVDAPFLIEMIIDNINSADYTKTEELLHEMKLIKTILANFDIDKKEFQDDIRDIGNKDLVKLFKIEKKL